MQTAQALGQSQCFGVGKRFFGDSTNLKFGGAAAYISSIFYTLREIIIFSGNVKKVKTFRYAVSDDVSKTKRNAGLIFIEDI